MENDMHYTSYGDIIDANVENVYRNGVASKILQHMDRIRNASDIRQARRWVMELLQNSRDVAYKDQQVRVKIELTDNYLIFSHNGMPFKVENILAIVNQVSSKIPSEDVVGQFGTGFITTFQLSETVEIKSVLKEDGLPYRPFSIQIDRRGRTKEEIMAGINKTMEMLKKADYNAAITEYDQNGYNTSFIYHLDNDESRMAARTGMEDLQDNILYVLLFVEKIADIRLKFDTADARYDVLYERQRDIPFAGDIRQLYLKETVEKSGTTKEHMHGLAYLKENNTTIAAGMEEKGFTKISERTSRVFVDFPLIGTENFPFPIVMNNLRLNPNEPRSGITLVDNMVSNDAVENKKIMENAVIMYQKFLHTVTQEQCEGIENIIDIPDWQNNGEMSEQWVSEHIYGKLYDIVSNEAFLDTSNGRKKLSDADLFLTEGKNETEKERLKKLLNALDGYVTVKSPEHWLEALHGYRLLQEKVISPEKVLCDIQGFLRGRLDESRMKAMEWCHELYLLAMANPELAESIKAGNVRIFPNQDESDWQQRTLFTVRELNYDDKIPEILKDVSSQLDNLTSGVGEEPLNIRKALLHKDFGITEDAGMEKYEFTRLSEHIIKRSSRGYRVSNYSLYSDVYNKAWMDSWCMMISCGKDEHLYDICKVVMQDRLPERKPLDNQYDTIIWKNSYIGMLEYILNEVSNKGNMENLCSWLFPEDNDKIYEWLNGVLCKILEYRQNIDWGMKVIPNQKGILCEYANLHKDATTGEELKCIAEELGGFDERCKVCSKLMDRRITLDKLNMLPMDDVSVAAIINAAVTRLLSEGNLADAEEGYQEACTRLLAWIQDNNVTAQKHFPTFWREEDQMKLLTPKSAVKIHKKAKELTDLLDELGVENIDEAKEIIGKIHHTVKKQDEAVSSHCLYNEEWDVFYGAEFMEMSEEDTGNILRQIGVGGEKYALEMIIKSFIDQGFIVTENNGSNVSLIRNQDDSGCSMADIEYPDSQDYHQAGWDICVKTTDEYGVKKVSYIEVKTHTSFSRVRNTVRLSAEQMIMAAGQLDNYYILMVLYDYNTMEGKEIKFYPNPIAQIASRKMISMDNRYMFRLTDSLKNTGIF